MVPNVRNLDFNYVLTAVHPNSYRKCAARWSQTRAVPNGRRRLGGIKRSRPRLNFNAHHVGPRRGRYLTDCVASGGIKRRRPRLNFDAQHVGPRRGRYLTYCVASGGILTHKADRHDHI